MKIFTASDLRNRITINKAAGITDQVGNTVDEPYSNRCTVWSNLYDKGTDVIDSNGELIHSVRTEITIRDRSDILESDQIIDTTYKRIFKQTSPPLRLIQSTGRWLQLTCQEVTNTHG